MTDAMLRRRDLAAAALLAFTPLFSGPADAKLKIISGNKVTSDSGSTSTSTTTSTTTTTTTSSTTSTLSTDTCAYGPPLLDTLGRANFANYCWGLNRDTSKSYAIEQSTDLTLHRHRFEVRSGDTWSGDAGMSRNRAEYCCTTRQANGREVWFSYAMMLHGGAPVSNWNVLGQFHSTPDPSEPSPSPPFSMNFIPGEKLRIVKRTDPNPMTTKVINPTIMYERVLSRNRWYRFVGRIVFGWSDNGACEIWMDGAKVVNLPITNIGYNDLIGPYWKFGIYRAAAAETLAAEYANLELSNTSLLSRVTSPLPIV